MGLGTFQVTDIGAFAVYGFHDVYHSHGNVAEVSYIAELPIGKAFTLYPSVGCDAYDASYNRYYYGVSKAEARRSHFHAYSPDESLSPFVNVTADIPVWKQWHVSATIQETFLGHSVTHSPIVSKHCQTTGILALAYQFKAKN
jgi:outer membrane protein